MSKSRRPKIDRIHLRLAFGLALLFAVGAAVAFGLGGQPASAATATAISAGGHHTCALTSAGGVRCWGDNSYGQLGDGTTASSSTPVDVTGLTTGVAAVSAGGFHTCALTSTGGVKCWGRNDFGQLGNGSTASSWTPVDVTGLTSGALGVSAGGFHTCGIAAGGGVKCWGGNNAGELGDGTTVNHSSPVDVAGLAGPVMSVAAGGSDTQGGHTCALTDSGAVKCWGRNDFGELGNDTTTGSGAPVDVTGLSSGVAKVAAGRYHSCALTTGGGAKCWGWNVGGMIGDGTFTTRLAPVDVAGLTSGVVDLSTGGLHTCAVLSTGGVRCWGANNDGQIGDGTSGNNRPSPVDVLEQLGGAPLDGIAAVAAGGRTTTGGHTCALTTVGTVQCWGLNANGQLGDGTTIGSSTPVDVVGFEPPATATATATDTETPAPAATETATTTPTATDTATDTATPTATDTASPPPTATSQPPTATPAAPTATPTSGSGGSSVGERIDGLRRLIESWPGPRGPKRELLAKLNSVERWVERGQYCQAARMLEHIADKVLRQADRRLPGDLAQQIAAEARALARELHAAGGCRTRPAASAASDSNKPNKGSKPPGKHR